MRTRTKPDTSPEWKEAATASAVAQNKSSLEREALPCQLSDHELALKGDELADLLRQAADVEAEMKATAKRYKSRLDILSAQASMLGGIILGKVEDRAVEVETTFAFDAGTMRRVRLDTGEVLDERPMSEKERNPDGPLFAPAKLRINGGAELECTVNWDSSWTDNAPASDDGREYTGEDADEG